MAEREHKVVPDSETWLAIEDWIEERLQTRLSRLEFSGQSIEETENDRGAIEELRELKNLVKPEVVLVSEHSEPDL